MTFAEYWEKNEPFGCNPEEVAELAWKAGVKAERERCAKIADFNGSFIAEKIAAKIREEGKCLQKENSPS